MKKTYKINNFVTFKIIKLIDSNSNYLGIFKLNDCLSRLKKINLDLIEISKINGISICKFDNYNKFLYLEYKKHRKLKNNKNKEKIKEVKFRLFTFYNDCDNKFKYIKNFLLKGLKVKITLNIKGREFLKIDIIKENVNNLINKISSLGFLTNKPNYFLKSIFLYFIPKNVKIKT
ncbi:translation initiation factor IF-3 [Candidatus Nasuia deltocephalinicola]|uniref:Translation initiation factor IF-3 n=1 Tax=Candidatus Nasuia deltocephalincola TaxID=1160784 RepID=A0A974WL45_9PROT|nr:translation initiation factor IF-3 [Candidatus Nasuia deltocephalinicola]WKD87083.1 translation initiation factor IF-3 [Candidatus Nasuia deltocephalinicola]BEH03853.1 translation initiation factor IF-3 [Candidatus Nasuia deltocephalinicola]